MGQYVFNDVFFRRVFQQPGKKTFFFEYKGNFGFIEFEKWTYYSGNEEETTTRWKHKLIQSWCGDFKDSPLDNNCHFYPSYGDLSAVCDTYMQCKNGFIDLLKNTINKMEEDNKKRYDFFDTLSPFPLKPVEETHHD